MARPGIWTVAADRPTLAPMTQNAAEPGFNEEVQDVLATEDEDIEVAVRGADEELALRDPDERPVDLDEDYDG